ncbi:NADH dehydrogenase [ubiquinone] 1 alpha subcomplex subunit 11-like [Homarus americanus]|uniref:NADH dehydrogenase [ubiquinone] 1 alpha subcomplex subunit 11 n=1 Tax=Homarus americanus TaxID=6706 RepID=A0A8J5MUX0_HOMAM|nr:NADH dehydrogenase [ubiquinone] 1 alpha subcomplex subunit 11-like [Homarus americanus]
MGYADHPDGQECFEKVFACTKYSGFAATYMKSTIPAAAAGATFATVSCVSTNLRGKDDKINYFLGGAAAGGVFGIAARTFRVGVPLGFFLGFAAIIYKDSKDEGWSIFPQTVHKMGAMDHRQFNFTLTPDK